MDTVTARCSEGTVAERPGWKGYGPCPAPHPLLSVPLPPRPTLYRSLSAGSWGSSSNDSCTAGRTAVAHARTSMNACKGTLQHRVTVHVKVTRCGERAACAPVPGGVYGSKAVRHTCTGMACASSTATTVTYASAQWKMVPLGVSVTEGAARRGAEGDRGGPVRHGYEWGNLHLGAECRCARFVHQIRGASEEGGRMLKKRCVGTGAKLRGFRVTKCPCTMTPGKQCNGELVCLTRQLCSSFARAGKDPRTR